MLGEGLEIGAGGADAERLEIADRDGWIETIAAAACVRPARKSGDRHGWDEAGGLKGGWGTRIRT